MEKIKLTIDSACDCATQILTDNNIRLVPFKVLFGEEDKLDVIEVSGKDVVDYIKNTNTLTRTSAPSVDMYETIFAEELENAENIIHFSLSTDFSVAHNNAIKASEKFNGRVKIVDTKSLSSGISLVMLYALDMVKEGKSVDEIVEACKHFAKSTQASFVVEDLTMLHKGGRCSGVALFVGKTLGIKPSLIVKNGKLIVNKKYLLQKYEIIVKRYVKDILAQFPNFNKKRCFVTYSPTEQKYIDIVKAEAEKVFDEVILSNAGAVISTHCGPNTIGILYVCNEEI